MTVTAIAISLLKKLIIKEYWELLVSSKPQLIQLHPMKSHTL